MRQQFVITAGPPAAMLSFKLCRTIATTRHGHIQQFCTYRDGRGYARDLVGTDPQLLQAHKIKELLWQVLNGVVADAKVKSQECCRRTTVEGYLAAQLIMHGCHDVTKHSCAQNGRACQQKPVGDAIAWAAAEQTTVPRQSKEQSTVQSQQGPHNRRKSVVQWLVGTWWLTPLPDGNQSCRSRLLGGSTHHERQVLALNIFLHLAFYATHTRGFQDIKPECLQQFISILNTRSSHRFKPYVRSLRKFCGANLLVATTACSSYHVWCDLNWLACDTLAAPDE